MTNPTVLDMVRAALKAGGYDGLFNSHGECACETDDLSPCGDGLTDECTAGFKVPCSETCDHGYGWSTGDWHIQAERPEPVGLVLDARWAPSTILPFQCSMMLCACGRSIAAPSEATEAHRLTCRGCGRTWVGERDGAHGRWVQA